MSNQPPLFVGRQTQLAELKTHWQEAYQKKRGKVVFLAGEAGIGKTALVEKFSQSVLKHYSGVQYAYAQCNQVTGDISPYAPFIQILNLLVEQAASRGDNWAKEYIREVGPDIINLIPVAGPFLTVLAKTGHFTWQRRRGQRLPGPGPLRPGRGRGSRQPLRPRRDAKAMRRWLAGIGQAGQANIRE